MRSLKNKRNGIFFVVVTMIWTWGVLAVPVLLRLGFDSAVTKAAYVLAGASPSVIGWIFVLLSGDRAYRRAFLKRIVTAGSARAIDRLAVFALVPAVTLFSSYASFLFTSVAPDFTVLREYSNDLAGLILFAAFTFVFGPLAEEIGWRGYLLDCWKDKGVWAYGTGIGFIWTLWHLPMFFIDGTYQYSLLSQGVIPVLCFVLSTTALGVIIGQIAKSTNSILLAIVFHFTINFTGELIPLSMTGEMINAVALVLIASGIQMRALSK